LTKEKSRLNNYGEETKLSSQAQPKVAHGTLEVSLNAVSPSVYSGAFVFTFVLVFLLLFLADLPLNIKKLVNTTAEFYYLYYK